MEERILSPIGLLSCVIAVLIHPVSAPKPSGFRRQGTEVNNFLNKLYWPMQIRPPP